jgi:Flp pilus assembly pilin Flp
MCPVHNARDRGATAVEYALMVSLIALVIFVAVTLLGGNLAELFQDPTLNSAIS